MSEIVAVIGAPAIAGLVALIVGRFGKKGERENLLIDQLQEDRDKDRARLDSLSEKVASLESRVLSLLDRDRQWSWHVGRLESQITHDLKATPIERPEALKEAL